MNLPPRSGCGTQLQHTDPRAQWQFASLLLRLLRLHFVWTSWFIFSSDVPTVSYQCLGRIGFLTCLHLMSLEEAQHLWLVRLRNLAAESWLWWIHLVCWVENRQYIMSLLWCIFFFCFDSAVCILKVKTSVRLVTWVCW